MQNRIKEKIYILVRWHRGNQAVSRGRRWGKSNRSYDGTSELPEFKNGALTGAFSRLFNDLGDLSHRYEFETEICSRSQSACTPGNVWDSVKNNSVPLQDGPLVDGAFNEIPGIGPVETLVDDLNYTLTNYTRGDHLFRDGTVTRSLVVTQDTISVSTVGVGTNINGAAWAANYAASPYFKAADINIKVNIGVQQIRNDVRSFFD